jgi:osmoprotectant transport system substrate-binding protein
MAAAGLMAAPRAVMAQGRDQRIVVASKIDTEGALLGNLIVQALRGAGLTVEPRLALGPTRIVRGALLAGEVDLYPEYTGNGAYFFERLADAAWRDGDQGAALVARLDLEANRLVWLERARGEQHLGHRRAAGRRAAGRAGHAGTVLRQGGAAAAGGLGRVRREPRWRCRPSNVPMARPSRATASPSCRAATRR